MEWIDLIGYAAAFSTTVSFLPQAVRTIKTKDTRSISLSMYVLFNIGVLLWLVYGIFLKDFPLMIANGITFLMAAVILYYKLKFK
jgi:MtN3 and saliva related transmembrane protein